MDEIGQRLCLEGHLTGRLIDMTQVWQVQVATPNKELATELARSAVEGRLAAGGQVIGPVTSVFWHLSEFGTGEEWTVILKTTEDRYKELEQHIVERHEWTNPEITAIPLAAGLAPYLGWVERTLSE
jgi:periplasmic divalent cation tolerance protein